MSEGLQLPACFKIGVASSAYQIEGAVFQDGKGESCIDRYCRIKPNWNEDSSNGDIACDSYNRIEEDIKLIKDLGVDFYRFSISWPRIAPNGDCKSGINQLGVEHYRHFINRLLEEGITPMVTMFHWDLPQQLQDLGGWSNKVTVDYFVEYARALFKEYGNMVKDWYTFNEPQLVGEFGYGGGPPVGMDPFSPGVIAPGIGDYLAAHHQIVAHGYTYRLYEKEFKPQQKGQVGIVLQVFWARPETNSEKDMKAAERSILFELDSMLHPIVKGDYPEEYKRILADNATKEGREKSRLPEFTTEEIKLLKGSFDYIGINEYSSFLISHGVHGPNPSQRRDTAIIKKPLPDYKTPGVAWLAHDPESIRLCLNYITKKYGRIPIYVSENGCDDPSGIHDIHRIEYLKGYLSEVVKAANDGCDIRGYTVWSLMDSFEWHSGYNAKFGIYHVDFSDKNRKRQPKDSTEVLKAIIKNKRIPS